MPTGYTANVCDGKVTEFSDFAMQCARAFGALITMRDDPSDAPIPEEFKPSTYSADRYSEAKEKLRELRALTPEQVEVRALCAYEEAVARVKQRNDADFRQNDRIDAMLAKVAAWTPPTSDHVEMKNFMAEQLRISKTSYRHDLPVRLSGPAWLAALDNGKGQ